MISLLIKTENVLGVYRNYNMFDKRDKIMILLRTVMEILINFIILAEFTGLVFEVTKSSEILKIYVALFHVVYFFNNTASFVCGIYFSSSYQAFVTNFRAVQHSSQNESTYKNLKIFFITAIFVIILLGLGRAVLTVVEYSVLLNKEFWPHDAWLALLVTYVEIRFLIEHLVLVIQITMIKHLLKCLNKSVLNQKINYNSTQINEGVNTVNKNNKLMIQTVKEWALKYNCLKRCAEELTLCFRHQVRAQTVVYLYLKNVKRCLCLSVIG